MKDLGLWGCQWTPFCVQETMGYLKFWNHITLTYSHVYVLRFLGCFIHMFETFWDKSIAIILLSYIYVYIHIYIMYMYCLSYYICSYISHKANFEPYNKHIAMQHITICIYSKPVCQCALTNFFCLGLFWSRQTQPMFNHPINIRVPMKP